MEYEWQACPYNVRRKKCWIRSRCPSDHFEQLTLIEETRVDRVLCAGVRMAVLRFIAVVLCAALSQLGFAEPSTTEAGAVGVPKVTVSTVKPQAQSKLICTREHVTGSNIKKKTCRTRAEVDAQRADAQRTLQDLGKNRSVNSAPGG